MYRSRIRVRGYELDSYGHVNNAVFFNYLEQARWEIFETRGLLGTLRESSLFLVVVDINIRYQHELKLGDEIEIISKVKKDAPFMIFEQRIRRACDGISVARARVKTVFVDGERISQDIPPEMEEIF